MNGTLGQCEDCGRLIDESAAHKQQYRGYRDERVTLWFCGNCA